MFTCSVCLKTIGPNIKPIRVITGIRLTSYHNEYFIEDEWGNRQKREVDSNGSEITGEDFVCPADGLQLGADVPNQKKSNVIPILLGKPVFQEPLAPALRCKLIAVVANVALDQANRTNSSKRTKQAIAVSIPLIKWFADNNTGYTF
jgi:hypothetical protein